MTAADDSASAPAPAVVSAPPASGVRHRGSYGKMAFEVALIALGVFLGLLADQWRERGEHHQLAEDTLRRFRAEFAGNRAAVAAVVDKHRAAVDTLHTYFIADAAARAKLPYPFMPTDPAFLEYTAWDLAIATQALSYVDPDLAQSVAHVYAVQRQLDAATGDITVVMYSLSGNADPAPLSRSLATYFGDCTLIEPRLLKLYDDILPRLDARLGTAH